MKKISIGLDIEKVRTAITGKTKAIILVAANGRAPSVGIAAFELLCKKRNLVLIEDAAQALGNCLINISSANLINIIIFSKFNKMPMSWFELGTSVSLCC